MREILFKGKGTHGFAKGKWVYGYYIKDFWGENHKGFGIHLIEGGYSEVDPETVGQYTGLTDKNGKKIFEGDIVRTDKGKIYEIKMRKGCWIVWNDTAKMTYDKWDFLNTFAPTVEVIGNMTDNPELLKGGENG